MATGIVTSAEPSGTEIIVTVTVDEGLAGMVDYTARVLIAELRALPTNAARRQALLNAIIAVRTDELQRQTQIDAFLGSIIGAQVTV
jgi:hypothetical protein